MSTLSIRGNHDLRAAGQSERGLQERCRGVPQIGFLFPLMDECCSRCQPLSEPWPGRADERQVTEGGADGRGERFEANVSVTVGGVDHHRVTAHGADVDPNLYR